MEGTFYRVFGDARLEITHKIGDSYYFYPILDNLTNSDCNVTINDGLEDEQEAGVIRLGSQNVHIGYYKWYSNSNVTLYCDEATYWYGMRNGDGDIPLNDLIASDGTVKLLFRDLELSPSN